MKIELALTKHDVKFDVTQYTIYKINKSLKTGHTANYECIK